MILILPLLALAVLAPPNLVDAFPLLPAWAFVLLMLALAAPCVMTILLRRAPDPQRQARARVLAWTAMFLSAAAAITLVASHQSFGIVHVAILIALLPVAWRGQTTASPREG